MKIREWLIMLVLVSLVITLGSTFIAGIGSSYDRPVEKNYTATYSYLSTIADQTNNMSKALAPTDPEDTVGSSGTGASISFMLTGAWTILRMVLGLPALLDTFIHDLAGDLGLPLLPLVAYSVSLIVAIIVIVGIAMIILKGGE